MDTGSYQTIIRGALWKGPSLISLFISVDVTELKTHWLYGVCVLVEMASCLTTGPVREYTPIRPQCSPSTHRLSTLVFCGCFPKSSATLPVRVGFKMNELYFQSPLMQGRFKAEAINGKTVRGECRGWTQMRLQEHGRKRHITVTTLQQGLAKGANTYTWQGNHTWTTAG